MFDIEQAHRYVTRLRGNPEQINPPDWQVDFADAPWPLKLYEGGVRRPLPGAGPAWLPPPERPDQVLGRLLFLTAGITRVRLDPHGTQLNSPERPTAVQPERRLRPRRAVASGGAMYPAELYVVSLAEGAVAPGVHHYDPAGHALVELKSAVGDVGGLAAALGAALRLPADGRLPATTVVIANRFWKNFHKYGDFAYRLGGVDLGVVLGRLLEIGEGGAGPMSVEFDFDDARLDAVLGLDGEHESGYVVVGLGTPTIPVPSPARSWQTVAPRVSERSALVKRSADFDAMHAAARAARLTDRDGGSRKPARAVSRPDRGAAMLHRTSNGPRFTGAAMTRAQFTAVLAETAVAIDRLNAVTAAGRPPRLRVHCAASRVTALPPAFYRYQAEQDDLVAVGDTGANPGARVHAALYTHGLNAELASATVHLVGAVDLRESAWGARAYRVQSMAVGVAVDAITVTCTQLGLGSHPLLGFDAHQLDADYGLARTGWGVLAQVCIGPVRPDAAIETSVTG